MNSPIAFHRYILRPLLFVFLGSGVSATSRALNLVVRNVSSETGTVGLGGGA